jgi:fructose-1,6-bisphosphatase/sedoheptulose 1,7-bisphosphatase-like protein
MILDRARHLNLITAVSKSGARIRLIPMEMWPVR